MNRIFLTIILLILVALPAFNNSSEAAQPDFTGALSYKVIRVIDGDTIILDIDGKETTVRLIGVDTPETVQPSK